MTIGILASAPGARSAAGTDAVRGAQLAVDLVNRSYPQVPMSLAPAAGLPRLRGATLNLAVADTGGGPAVASDQVNSLINAGATALIISDGAEVTAAAGSQAQKSQVPLLDAGSTADYVTELGLDWYFRTVPTDRALAEAAFALLRRQIGATAAARIVYLTEAGGQNAATAELVRDMAVRAGHAIVVERVIAAPGQASGEREPILNDECDVILALATTPAAATEAYDIAAQMATPVPIVGLGKGFDGAPRAPDAAPVVLRTVSWSAELARRNPVGRAVTELYERLFGVPMTVNAANSFTATMALAVAIDAAGSTEPATIRGALRQLTLSATQMIMPWNGIRFDSDGQNRLAAAVIEGSDSAGFRVVFPRELSAGPMIWTDAEGQPR